MTQNYGLVWVESGGGPLLLLDQGLAEHWTGIFTPGADPEEDPLEGTDYGRACEVEDYLDIIDIGLGQGVVLGGEPAPTTWWPLPEGGGLLVRWLGAEREEDVIAAVSDPSDVAWEAANIELHVTSRTLLLLDSACSAAECEPGAVGGLADSLAIDIKPGTYRFDTALLEPNESMSLLLHRLTAASTGS